METTYMTILRGHFVNRGFLNGPFCPIYGFAALFLIFLLSPLKDNKFLFFLAATVTTTILEYITSVLLEVLFNQTLWSYKKEAFNINGRVCLKFSLIWGFAALLMVNLLHPHIERIINKIPVNYKSTFSVILILYFILDCTLTVANTTNAAYRLKMFVLSNTNIKAGVKSKVLEELNPDSMNYDNISNESSVKNNIPDSNMNETENYYKSDNLQFKRFNGSILKNLREKARIKSTSVLSRSPLPVQ